MNTTQILLSAAIAAALLGAAATARAQQPPAGNEDLKPIDSPMVEAPGKGRRRIPAPGRTAGQRQIPSMERPGAAEAKRRAVPRSERVKTLIITPEGKILPGPAADLPRGRR